jgi:hypothetical protein
VVSASRPRSTCPSPRVISGRWCSSTGGGVTRMIRGPCARTEGWVAMEIRFSR